MRIIDISPPITERLAVWPGDVPFSRPISSAIANGSNIDLSSIHTTVHLGAHTDAPSHYTAGGPGIGERSLEPYYGPCQVIQVNVARGERIRPSHIRDTIFAPRVLFKTGTFPDPEHWNEDFASLSPELIDAIAGSGGLLVGIDTPSIDPFDSKALEAHQAVARHDLAILEGIVLAGVPAGSYGLVALPLRIPGADASPVRAVLIDRQPGGF
jgi:arylformamidase